jgi:hypothetical protein
MVKKNIFTPNLEGRRNVERTKPRQLEDGVNDIRELKLKI